MTEPRNLDPFSDREPPRVLQQRITRTLQAGGLLQTRAVRLRRQVLRSGALLVLVAAAFLAGRMQRGPATGAGPEFLLLLYEDSVYRDDRPVREIVAEYAVWADSLRHNDALVLGEKLGRSFTELPAPMRADQVGSALPTGLFIVRANDLTGAATIAGTSPHLRFGGRIVVHSIDH